MIIIIFYAVLLSALICYFKFFGICGKSFFLGFLVCTHFASLPMTIFANLVDGERYLIGVEDLSVGVAYSFFGVLCYILFSLLFYIFNKNKNIKVRPSSSFWKILFFVFISISLLSFVAYVASEGVTLSVEGGYESRLSGNAGNGLLILGITAAVPAIVVFTSFGKKKFIGIKSIVLVVCFGMAYYVVVGGSRNVLAACFLSVIMILLLRKLVSIKSVVVLGVLLLFSLNLLVFFRYGMSFANDVAVGTQVRYMIDSLSPLNFQSIGVREVVSNSFDPEGWRLFFNQFLSIVPRSLWPDKPIVIMNSSYYFSKNILGLDSNLNMASTMLVSSMIVHGKYLFFINYIIAALVMGVVDIFLKSKNVFLYVFACSVIPFSFFMARESVELYLFILIKFSLIIIPLSFVAIFIYNIMLVVSVRSRMINYTLGE